MHADLFTEVTEGFPRLRVLQLKEYKQRFPFLIREPVSIPSCSADLDPSGALGQSLKPLFAVTVLACGSPPEKPPCTFTGKSMQDKPTWGVGAGISVKQKC